MAKKKGKVVQMLSPENYIRQRARKLPVHECFITKGWEQSKEASIIISRKHTNGNFTVGFYLVDLLCLGVKDAHFKFNIPAYEYTDLLEYMHDSIDLEAADYRLVHNVIFAGLEFAEDYGFKPSKGFSSTMQYFLNEDNDDVELLEIECGDHGQPMYVRGPLDSDAEVKRILAQLEKTAGPGNYKYLEEEKDPSIDDDDRMYQLDPYSRMSLKEKLDLYVRQYNDIENLSVEEKRGFSELMESIVDEFIDGDKAHDLYSAFKNEAQKIAITDDLTDEFLFGSCAPDFDPSEIRMEFPRLYEQLAVEKKKTLRELKKLQKKYPETPSLCFLELNILRETDLSSYDKKLLAYAKLFPEYSLMKILNQIRLLNSSEPLAFDFSFEKSIPHFFSSRKCLNRIELFYLFMLLLFRAMVANCIEEIDAIEYLLEGFVFTQEEREMLDSLILLAKLDFIASHIDDGKLSDKLGSGEPDKLNFSADSTENSQTFQFKIQIKGITKPPVWRRITVPSHYTFLHFHQLIQAAFGWTSSHLFLFSENGFDSETIITEGADDMASFDQEELQAAEIKLSEVFKWEKQNLSYVYDFGDYWEHKITLETIIPEQISHPDCLAGKGKCPPEDCGGVGGYTNMKEILSDPRNPEYKDYASWLFLGENERWDPTEFQREEVRKRLKNIFTQ
ncbi:plasmid pRiA4b ORF-3 family protein [Mangrovibacterium marinum]|uniref:PRiA4b ORF-3-like protein n=1 Tax=Mangrovibacterium marinum TaxID=1639118 RepID=A0A2T5C471_9BACT|nr:plasmid pRiA4b ORF-3 family protein [Mangrovibacterium marinum]PTN09620.1 pRiA4b ORF-3-like protein [Mangrovibacterium marinum]